MNTDSILSAAPLFVRLDTARLDLLEPGVVSCSQWRPDPAPWVAPPVLQYGGVARKTATNG